MKSISQCLLVHPIKHCIHVHMLRHVCPINGSGKYMSCYYHNASSALVGYVVHCDCMSLAHVATVDVK